MRFIRRSAASQKKLAVSGVNRGLFCSTLAVTLTPTISRKRAAEMLMTGEFIDAATALNWGLVNGVVPANALRNTTLKLCETLKAKPLGGLATDKALFYRLLELGMEAAYAVASATIACNFADDDAQEGVAAFLAKRKPDWV